MNISESKRFSIAKTEELYRKLLADGVATAEIDVGWRDEFGTTVGAGDEVIERREVIGYLYEHWQCYGKLIATRTEFSVPWSLDDYNSFTDFDAKVRKAAAKLIERARAAVAKEGMAPEAAGFTRALAWAIQQEAIKDEAFLKETASVTHTGDAIAVEDIQELSALEYLKSKRGSCTENSKVMLGLYAMAGIRARAIDVVGDENGRWMRHMAVQVEVAPGEWLVADASLKKFDVSYQAILPLSMAELAGYHYDQGMNGSHPLLAHANLNRSLFLCPRLGNTRMPSLLFSRVGRDRGIALLRNYFRAEGDRRAEFTWLTFMGWTASAERYQAEVDALRREDPGVFDRLMASIESELRLSVSEGMEREFDLLMDLAQTPRERKEAFFLRLKWRMKKEGWKKIAQELLVDAARAVEGDGPAEETEMLLAALFSFGDRQGFLELAQRWLVRHPSSTAIQEQLLKAEFDQALVSGDLARVERAMEAMDEAGTLWMEDLLSAVKLLALGKGVAEAIRIEDAWVGRVKAGSGGRQRALLRRAMLALAAEDTGGFSFLLQSLPPEENKKFITSWDEIDYRRIARVIAYLVDGREEEAIALREAIREEDGGRIAIDSFLSLYAFLPARYFEFLRN